MSMRSAGTLDTRILAVKDDDAIIQMARENSATSDARKREGHNEYLAEVRGSSQAGALLVGLHEDDFGMFSRGLFCHCSGSIALEEHDKYQVP